MEYSLHRDLKTRYADQADQTEVRLGKFRIDAVRGDELIEIQHGPLSAIRDKIRHLCRKHRVLVVKPIIASKLLVKRSRKQGPVAERRQSPKRGVLVDVFGELVSWTRVFPHPNLTLEVVLVDVEEWRYPGHGRRRWRRPNAHQVEDQKLLAVHDHVRFHIAGDLISLLPGDLSQPFHSGQLAQRMEIHRSSAQQILYCLRHMGGVKQVGKQGNALLYELAAASNARRPTRRAISAAG